jgi:hypothetical protein
MEDYAKEGLYKIAKALFYMDEKGPRQNTAFMVAAAVEPTLLSKPLSRKPNSAGHEHHGLLSERLHCFAE